MKTVYKYPVPRAAKTFSIILPVNFRFLRVHFQEDNIFLWAEVVKDTQTKQFDFQVFGTGQDIPDSAKYLTTYDDGPFVFHLFQVN